MLTITDEITDLELKLAQLRRAEQECRDIQDTLKTERECAVEVQKDVFRGIDKF